jgi:glutathione S-transferase
MISCDLAVYLAQQFVRELNHGEIMLKVWGRRNSFNVQKVMWLIGELDIPHEHIPAGSDFGGLDTPEFLAINPHGRIPVIQDIDGTTVWESHAILRYLAARYNNGLFWSEDARVRSLADRWMDWSQATLQPNFLTGIFWGFYRTPEHQRNWSSINENVHRCGQYFLLLDHILSNQPYLGGSTLTLADIPAGTTLYRYFELDIKRPVLTNVEAWYSRLQERVAYREHVMVPFEDLKGKLEAR